MPARNRPVTVAGTVAALALSLGLPACSSSHHRASPTTPPTTTAKVITTQPSPGLYNWVRDASPALAIGGGASSTLAAVLAPQVGQIWTVAGTRSSADGSTTATVWTSTNSRTWSGVALTGPQVDSQVDAAADWKGETVVAGSIGRGSDEHAAAWISRSPGSPFTQAAGNALTEPDTAVTSIAGGDLGWFAAGTANGRVMMWYSSNGQSWTQLTGAQTVIGAASDPHVDALLVTTDAVYAAGWDRNASAIDAALWSSEDGVTWHQVRPAQDAFSGTGEHLITGLAELGTGLVAVGGSGQGGRWRPTSWISPNGISWSAPSTGFTMGARSQAGASDAIVRAISGWGTPTASLVAVGGGPTAQRVWSSTDGVHWVESPLPAKAGESEGWQASLVGLTASQVVVADGVTGQPHLLVDAGTKWLEPSANPANFGPVAGVARPAGLVAAPDNQLVLAVDVAAPEQALGAAGSTVAFLTSSDAVTWTAVTGGPNFAGGKLRALVGLPAPKPAQSPSDSSVAASTAGSPSTTTASTTAPTGEGSAPLTALLAVGGRSSGTAGLERASAWLSNQGTVWQSAGSLDTAAIGLPDQANGACATSHTVVAVGSESASPGIARARAWFSDDGGRRWAAATFPPPSGSSGADISEILEGCVAVTPASRSGSAPSAGFEAFGTTTTAAGVTQPGFWFSARGTKWTHLTVAPFGSSFPFPARSVAAAGNSSTWLATGGVTPVPDWVFGAGPQELSGLWQSSNNGSMWVPEDRTAAEWLGSEPTQINQVTFFNGTPVAAGEVDGQLAVWTGVPSA